jgi:hypothetical protein
MQSPTGRNIPPRVSRFYISTVPSTRLWSLQPRQSGYRGIMCRITVFVAESCESLSLEESEGGGIVSTSERRQEGGNLKRRDKKGKSPRKGEDGGTERETKMRSYHIRARNISMLPKQTAICFSPMRCALLRWCLSPVMPLNVECGRWLAEERGDNEDNRGQLVCTDCKQPSTVDPEARKLTYDNLIIGGLLSDCTRCGCVGWIAGVRGMSGVRRG